MSRSTKCLIALFAASVAFAIDKNKDGKFKPGAASSYPSHQTVSGVTVAAAAYHTPELAREAFGKANPYEYGVLPVLLVIQNDTKQALRIDSLVTQLITHDRQTVDPTPASEVKYLAGGRTARVGQSPLPTGRPPLVRDKNKLDTWEIEGRAFEARMLPAGEAAHGFFYFRAPYRVGAQVLVKGIREAATGKELFYFEIPLKSK